MFWENLWNVIWLLFLTFALVAYLFVLFAIIADLFRDRTLNGWWKALWIIFLIFVPFLTALIYVAVRGRGMAERSSRDAAATQQATDSYIRSVAASGGSPTDEIAKAKKLLDDGTITAAEYTEIKTKALA